MGEQPSSEVGDRARLGHPREDWADDLAASVSGPQVINDSKTPSGTVHVGSLRGPVILHRKIGAIISTLSTAGNTRILAPSPPRLSSLSPTSIMPGMHAGTAIPTA